MAGPVAAKLPEKDKTSEAAKGKSISSMSPDSPYSDVLKLQHSVGNRAVNQLLQRKSTNEQKPETVPPIVDKAFASLSLEEAIKQIPNMPQTEAINVLKRFQTFISIRISSGEGRIRQLIALRAESFSNYLIGGTIEIFGFTSLPSENWEKPWKPLNDAYATIAKHQVKESLQLLVESTKITNEYWTHLNEYLDKTDKGADRSIFVLQALQAAGAVAATALTGGGATAVVVGAGYAATQNFAGQATSVAIGIQKEIDWTGMTFDTLFGVVTGALGGKLGNTVLKRLMGDPKFASLGRRFLSEVVSDLVSGRISSILQTTARSVFDQLRGKEKLTVEGFLIRLIDQLFDPKAMFLDAIMGRAAKIAHAPSSQRSNQAPSGKITAAKPPKAPMEPAPHVSEPAQSVKPAHQAVASATSAPPEAASGQRSAKVAGSPFWRRFKAPAKEMASTLEPHPDFPNNVLVESGIPGFDMKKMMRHLETTPQGELIAQKIRNGEIHVVFTSEPIAEGYSGMAYGKEIQVTWAGTVEETTSTLIHEGTHWMEPDLAKVGTPEGSSSLSIEGSARAFEYEQRLKDNLPAYDAAEQAHRDTHDRVLRETGDERAANIAADRAMLEAMQLDHTRYGGEAPATKPTVGDATKTKLAAKPLQRPQKTAKGKVKQESEVKPKSKLKTELKANSGVQEKSSSELKAKDKPKDRTKPGKEPKAETQPEVKPKEKRPSAIKKPKTAGAPEPPKSLDERITDTERALNEARRRVVDYKKQRLEAGEKQKGGPYKGLYNELEHLWTVKRAKAYPNRQLLEQAEIVGVKGADGKIKSAKQIAGKGRTLDFVEVDGKKVLAGDLKSKDELINSIEGGIKDPSSIEGVFRDKSKIGVQHGKEEAVLAKANKSGGKLVIRGKDVKTGKVVTIEVDSSEYASTVMGLNFSLSSPVTLYRLERTWMKTAALSFTCRDSMRCIRPAGNRIMKISLIRNPTLK
jgi:hypothetical protein